MEKSRLGDSSLRMGTLAVKGNCQAEVTAIGMQTEMGKIAGMLEEIAPEMTPLAQRLEQLGEGDCRRVSGHLCRGGSHRNFPGREPL